MRSELSPSLCAAFPFPSTACARVGHDRQRLERDVRTAVAQGQFHIHWQPIVDCRVGTLYGFEALLRWDRPGHGPVSPSVFVPIAEDLGLHQQVDTWVLRRACAEAARWPEPLRFAVNVSAGWFDGRDLSVQVENALRTTKLDPARMELEVTERIFFDSAGFALSELAYLKALGVRLSLDDFGTGFSSLGTLRTIAFDKIKLDRTFIQTLGTCRRTEVIVRSLLQLSTGLGMQVCAEGVELESQLGILQAYQCDEVQGYLIGRPAAINPDTFLTYARLRDRDIFANA